MAETHETAEIGALEIGDRVALQRAEVVGRGTVLELLGHGMVRVKWDQPELTAIHWHEQLTKLIER
jgi:hypothetical protein